MNPEEQIKAIKRQCERRYIDAIQRAAGQPKSIAEFIDMQSYFGAVGSLEIKS